MKHNTDQIVTQVSTNCLLLGVKKTSSPHLGTQRSYFSTRTNFLASRFLELFLHNDGMLTAPISVWLGYISLVPSLVVGATVDWSGVHEPGICPNFFNTSLYFGSKESIFFQNSDMFIALWSMFGSAMHNLLGSLLALGSPWKGIWLQSRMSGQSNPNFCITGVHPFLAASHMDLQE